jgi:hypothetical protein
MRSVSLPFSSCLTIVSLTLSSGCAQSAKPAHASAPAPIVVGEIAVVDEEEHFVLIDLESSLSVPEPGALLRATNASGGTAHLRAAAEQKRPFVAADILDGHPAVGDQVSR